MNNIFCKLNIHFWELIKGNFNKYYQCKKCGKRKVEIGKGEYPKIDQAWLDNNIYSAKDISANFQEIFNKQVSQQYDKQIKKEFNAKGY
jgi:hypothetical protein